MTDRAIRNLAHLGRSASTARVLNLLKVWRDHGRSEAWAARPLFVTPILNRALVIKHRLRRDELDNFHLRRHVATKVVIPIEAEDLKTGGRFLFVDQKGFERSAREAFGISPDHRDIAVLRRLDRLPSLDPFLLREQLRAAGIDPAPCYFGISDADLARMTRFVDEEIRPLVTLSIGPDIEAVGSTRRLTDKILSNDPGDRMEALRVTLRLEPDNYQEGIFCWKGFLYYKWVLTSLTAEISSVADAISAVRPLGRPDAASKAWLEDTRLSLRDRVVQVSDAVGATLKIYDDAYAELIRHSRPTAFRDFLLNAPGLFARLGEQLGAIQHIVSFWHFRFSPSAAPVSVDELIDIFMDFETGLADRDQDLGTPMLAA